MILERMADIIESLAHFKNLLLPPIFPFITNIYHYGVHNFYFKASVSKCYKLMASRKRKRHRTTVAGKTVVKYGRKSRLCHISTDFYSCLQITSHFLSSLFQPLSPSFFLSSMSETQTHLCPPSAQVYLTRKLPS